MELPASIGGLRLRGPSIPSRPLMKIAGLCLELQRLAHRGRRGIDHVPIAPISRHEPNLTLHLPFRVGFVSLLAISYVCYEGLCNIAMN